MDIYAQMAEKIIAQQETIIGPVALEQAELVPELSINWKEHKVSVKGNGQGAIDQLVTLYKDLFGQIAVETCKEAVVRVAAQLTPEQLPSSLK